MKIVFYLTLINVSTLIACAQTNSISTNDVAIGNRGISFSIKDFNSTNGEREIFSDHSLSWVLHNSTQEHQNVHWEGIEHTFSLKLFDNQGREMPLTDYGKQMNSGPFPLPKTGSIHLIGLPPGHVDNRNFPALTNLFLFPRPGDYEFEARYWYIEIGSGQWKLSEPVRLKVIKRDDPNKSK